MKTANPYKPAKLAQGEPPRQSAAHWQARLRSLGWNISQLATALGVSRSHLSRVIHNPRRSLQWECCLCGLPPLNPAWQRQLQLERKHSKAESARHPPAGLHGPGSVYRVAADHDSLLMPAGSRAVCLAVRQRQGQDEYRLRFDGGGEDWFDLASLHHLLVETGETVEIAPLTPTLPEQAP